MKLLLSRRSIAVRRAVEAVDAYYADLVSAEIGPLGALHALKRAQAVSGEGPLIDGDRESILARASEQDARLASLDRARRSLKQRIREAATAADIHTLLLADGIHIQTAQPEAFGRPAPPTTPAGD